MALNGDEEDFEWEPPTEAEMKVIQARRERQDKISKLMGDYLLKGYKMLGDCCEACGPTSSQAGVSVPQPRPEHCEGAAAGGRALLPPPVVASPPPPASTTTLAPIRPPVCPQSSTLQPALEEAEEAVLTKLRWATTQLQSSASLEASIQLCSLIGSCANSLRSLRELSQ
ncbi:protein ZNRD2 [Poecilia reticulata]|uniref:protein ZNRD2 n=1 Tax=Poecilia reticulata TaxID=8081 RepID=UPI0007EA0C6F|nr:PREDICTED: Sjoegren syndrome/scleroderma autoantigen 1 [Poecilia reticulata]